MGFIERTVAELFDTHAADVSTAVDLTARRTVPGGAASAGEAVADAEGSASRRGADAATESLLESDGCVGGSPNCPMLEHSTESAWRAGGASTREPQSANRLRSREVARDAPTGVREQLTSSLARCASGGNAPSVAGSGSYRNGADVELALSS